MLGWGLVKNLSMQELQEGSVQYQRGKKCDKITHKLEAFHVGKLCRELRYLYPVFEQQLLRY